MSYSGSSEEALDVVRAINERNAMIEQLRAEIEQWKTKYEVLQAQGRQTMHSTFALLGAERRALASAEKDIEKLRELIQRTVVHADNLLLILPPEMIAEFREVLTATENK